MSLCGFIREDSFYIVKFKINFYSILGDIKSNSDKIHIFAVIYHSYIRFLVC